MRMFAAKGDGCVCVVLKDIAISKEVARMYTIGLGSIVRVDLKVIRQENTTNFGIYFWDLNYFDNSLKLIGFIILTTKH